MDTTAADDFWTVSSLGPLTTERFGRRLAAYAPPDEQPHPWMQAGPSIPLDRARLVPTGRRSARAFADAPLTAAHVGGLLSCLAADDSGRRRYAAGGGLYVVGATVLALRVEAPLGGRVWQHDAVGHSVTDVGPCPPWPEEQPRVIPGGEPDEPAAIVLLFADLQTVRAKYGLRGDRFVLLEAGAALHELGLAAASLGLAGYALGGAWDERMRAVAGLSRTEARFVVAYAAGLPR